MKILFYIDSLGAGGAQRVMSNLANYFYDKRDTVVFVTDYPLDNEKYTINAKIRRIYLRDGISGNPMIKNLQRIITLRRVVSTETPDVVISFLGHPNTRMLLATIRLKCKKIVSVRNDPFKEYGSKATKKRMINRLFRLADGIVFQTEDASKYFDNSIREKSSIIFNPVSNVFFNTDLNSTRKDIITLGRLNKQKNHVLLIEAFSEIKDQIDGNLYIYGEGELREKLEEKIIELKLNNRVFLMGNTSEPENILSGAKIFVLSSDYEGMPNALMEAMAIGVPCIATDCPCGGPRALLGVDFKALIPVGDKQALRTAILELYTSETLQNVISESVRNKAAKFRPEIILNEWDDYIERIVNRGD